jgi:hypothetical protein
VHPPVAGPKLSIGAGWLLRCGAVWHGRRSASLLLGCSRLGSLDGRSGTLRPRSRRSPPRSARVYPVVCTPRPAPTGASSVSWRGLRKLAQSLEGGHEWAAYESL